MLSNFTSVNSRIPNKDDHISFFSKKCICLQISKKCHNDADPHLFSVVSTMRRAETSWIRLTRVPRFRKPQRWWIPSFKSFIKHTLIQKRIYSSEACPISVTYANKWLLSHFWGRAFSEINKDLFLGKLFTPSLW